MKKLILGLLILPLMSIAQDGESKEYSGEIKSNLFDLVVGKSFNVGYEHFLKGNQSVQLDVTLFDTYSYIDASELEKNGLIGIQASYNIYFSKSKKQHGFVFSPFLKYRVGKQETIDYYYYYDYNNGTGSSSNMIREFDLSGLEAGFGIGHKWLFNDKISLTLGSQIARNFSNSKEISDNYSDINFKAHVTLGFRL
ncbi:hypothetical protein [uncultured Flavobacterium sp.]|uniref:hypothetical protein n=1 Tax=uncultured Flavobacterium sp. TaxID=165435 RepID=UPI0030EF5B0C|tara:strand:- start:5931 stop:6518 length:588 start_codon:yes stop_codon:yes gene_type:complete